MTSGQIAIETYQSGAIEKADLIRNHQQPELPYERGRGVTHDGGAVENHLGGQREPEDRDVQQREVSDEECEVQKRQTQPESLVRDGLNPQPVRERAQNPL